MNFFELCSTLWSILMIWKDCQTSKTLGNIKHIRWRPWCWVITRLTIWKSYLEWNVSYVKVRTCTFIMQSGDVIIKYHIKNMKIAFTFKLHLRLRSFAMKIHWLWKSTRNKSSHQENISLIYVIDIIQAIKEFFRFNI